MKTLVVVTHPDMANSVVNKRWLEELRRYPERYTVHELHQAYPDWQIDVAQEQRLIEAHDNIVLQFPIFWFSSPPLLKKWLDDVLTYGWAYGSRSGYKMQNKKLALAQMMFCRPIPQILPPFPACRRRCAASAVRCSLPH
jgi:putative NADPH-quinone reductase